MIRVFYVSTASPSFGNGDLEALVDKAARNNEARDITGALAFNGVNFGQVLEGEEETIAELMEMIRCDVRHDGVIVIQEKQVEGRAFENWSMKRIKGLEFDELVAAMAKG